jgi:hypothetical protein
MPSFDFGMTSGEMTSAAAVKPDRRRNFALVNMDHPSEFDSRVIAPAFVSPCSWTTCD